LSEAKPIARRRANMMGFATLSPSYAAGVPLSRIAVASASAVAGRVHNHIVETLDHLGIIQLFCHMAAR
jgi:hypothetical protein